MVNNLSSYLIIELFICSKTDNKQDTKVVCNITNECQYNYRESTLINKHRQIRSAWFLCVWAERVEQAAIAHS